MGDQLVWTGRFAKFLSFPGPISAPRRETSKFWGERLREHVGMIGRRDMEFLVVVITSFHHHRHHHHHVPR
jgi:hypothetical protein